MYTIAFKELININNSKQKCKYIKYEGLQMADYLQPEAKLNITEKLEIFALRREMSFSPYNFVNLICCEKIWQEERSNNHIFECLKPNNQETKLKCENIFNGTLTCILR